VFGVAVGLDHHGRMDPVPVDKVQPRDDEYHQDRSDQQFASAHGSSRLGARVEWLRCPYVRRTLRLIQVHVLSLNSYPFLSA
jgi:hypothetical protein